MNSFSRLVIGMCIAVAVPFSSQAAPDREAVVVRDTTLRSCPNRLCPAVKTLPKGTVISWAIAQNGFVNLSQTTYCVSVADLS